MSTQLAPAPANELPRRLFQHMVLAGRGDEIDRAMAAAGRRWPILQPSLQAAADLVRANGIHEVPAETLELALIRLPAEWAFRAISPSPTGLACTCGGWPPALRAGPGDGLYCADILAYLLALYLQRPLSPLPHSPEELWQTALGELRLQMTKATFNQWLLGSVVIPEESTPMHITLSVRNLYAQAWLNHRLHTIIVSTLAAVAGHCVQVHFVVLNTMRNI